MLVQRQSHAGHPLTALPFVFAATSLGLALTLDGEAGLELCPVRRCTGGYCAGCGASRAAVALVRGDVSASWGANPWLLLLVVQAVIVGAATAVRGGSWMRHWSAALLIFNLALGTAIWIVRLSLGLIPVPFG